MDDPDQQSPLVSSSSSPAGGQPPPPPPPQHQPRFQYQFIGKEDEDQDEEEEDEEDEDDDDEVDDERLEVRERKPGGVASAPASAPAPVPAPPRMAADAGQAPPRPPPAPLPAWTSHPAAASSTAPFGASQFASPPQEKEGERDPPRSAPPPPPPHRPEPPAPAVPPRSAPLPPKRDDEPPAPPVAARKRDAASSSPEESVFVRPVASEPLMPTSTDKGMDSRELLGHARAGGHEDFAVAAAAAVTFDAPASLPCLSPLSANPFKEYAALDMVSDGFSAKGSYGQSEAFQTTPKSARNPFLPHDEDDDEAASNTSEIKSSRMVPPYSGAEPFSLFPTKELMDGKGKSDADHFSVFRQDSSPESPVDLFSKNDKVTSREDNSKYDIDDRDAKVAFVGDRLVREEYVDFKPFEPTWASDELSGLKDAVMNQVAGKLEGGRDVDKAVPPLPVEKDFEKDSESSNEEISFPSTPDATKESSDAYITCAKFDSATILGGIMAKSLPPAKTQVSENKTDEKKIAEMKAHLDTELSGTLTESTRGQGREADHSKPDSLPKWPAEAASNMPEGLTPDLVQEACESELHDAVAPKLAYETQIDLVQTSEPLQDPLNAAMQPCPSFEGGSESSPPPTLPDIVMEAPLSASPGGATGPAMQLEDASLETFTAAVANYGNVIQKSEKPPSYQEAMNVPATQVQEAKVESDVKASDSKGSATGEGLETMYISIACDLVKETEVPNEFASADYSKTALTDWASQPVPAYAKQFENAASPSGKSDLFSSQSELDLAVKEKPLKMTAKFVTEEGREELPPSLRNPYLESFHPLLESSRNAPTAWAVEAEAADLAKKEKASFETYSNDFSGPQESKEGTTRGFSEESSPETEDFPTISHQAVKLAMETSEKDALKGRESKETGDAAKAELRQPPYQEVAQDLSLKTGHVKPEPRDVAVEKPSKKLDREGPEAAQEPLALPLPTETKVVSVGKDTGRRVTANKEKAQSSLVFRSKLSKPSVVDLLYWRDVKKSGVVFGASLFLLLSLTVFSIVSVVAYIALGLLSVTISFRIYKGVIQAVQKSDEGHPFGAYLDKDVAVSDELVQKYSHAVLDHTNNVIKELRRLFLVDDLVDSLKFAVLMWVFTYVGALFNGLTLMILALISLFSVPVIYEKHQAQIDHYLGLVNKNVKDAVAKIQAKIPGLKRKAE